MVPAHSSPLTMAEICAGIGGFHHALSDPLLAVHLGGTVTAPDGTRRARGYEVIWASELDAAARDTYRRSFPYLRTEQVTGDIKDTTCRPLPDGSARDATDEEIRASVGVSAAGDLDALTFGWPCQPWSKAGAQRGFEDARGTVIFEIIKFVRATRPKVLIGENIPAFNTRHRPAWDRIVAEFRALGYRMADAPTMLSPHQLPPEAGGQPQQRQRAYMLGTYVGPDADLVAPAADVDAVIDALGGWNPDEWVVSEVLDSDDTIADLDQYVISARTSAYISAWNDLLRALPCASADLPGVLIVETFRDDWSDGLAQDLKAARAVAVGKPVTPVDSADLAKMRRSHDFYRQHATVIDGWLARPIVLDGQVAHVTDMPDSRQRLEFQARQAQPTAQDRDLWALTLQMRSSGIRVRPLTYLPCLVAMNTTSIIGPRRRVVTPREVARLQGLPVGVWTTNRGATTTSPPAHVTDVLRTAGAREQTLFGGQAPVLTTRTNVTALRTAAQDVADVWWARGGVCPEAIDIAIDGADKAGALAGEVIVAAGALVLADRRWRGSHLAWSSLPFDTYTSLAAVGHPVAYEQPLAAVDWRVRYRMAVRDGQLAYAAAANGGTTPHTLTDDSWLAPAYAAAFYAQHAPITLPGPDQTWDHVAQTIVHAATTYGFDLTWLRAAHRSALLATCDPHHPWDGLNALDDALAALGYLEVVDLPNELDRIGSLVAAGQRDSAARGWATSRPSAKFAGVGPAIPPAAATADTIAAARGAMDTALGTWQSALRRAQAVAALGQRDRRAENAVLDAQRAYVEAALALRHLRPHADDLRYAARVAFALAEHTGQSTQTLDLAWAAQDAWVDAHVSAPFGPPDRLMLAGARPSLVQDNNARAAALSPTGDVAQQLERMLGAWDATAYAVAVPATMESVVMLAAYERRRELVEYVTALAREGVVDAQGVGQIVAGVARRASLAEVLTEMAASVDLAFEAHALAARAVAGLPDEESLASLHRRAGTLHLIGPMPLGAAAGVLTGGTAPSALAVEGSLA